jgi:hypothetical protein
MAGSTVELNLSTAVDSDDNADYLTINLANSLRTVDGLFNNVTGHTHGGAHQGGPITPAAGSITSAQIADGTIATADLANAAVTNAKLGTDTARANLLTNGGFEIWQRGVGAFTSNGSFTTDRWQLVLAGTDTLSVSKNTANTDGSPACAAATFTLGSGAGGTALIQTLFGDTKELLGKTVSFSVRIRTSSANAVRIRIYDGSTATSSTFHTGGGTYETLSVTYAVPAASSTLWFDINFVASCTAYIDNAMLVVGSVAANYAPMHPADDLARCLRYYEVIGDPGAGDIIVAGIASGAGQNAQATINYKAKKPVTPTLTVVGTWNTVNASALSPNASTSATRILNTSSAAGPFLTYNATAGNCITLEANP